LYRYTGNARPVKVLRLNFVSPAKNKESFYALEYQV
jgi:hypothetical protein